MRQPRGSKRSLALIASVAFVAALPASGRVAAAAGQPALCESTDYELVISNWVVRGKSLTAVGIFMDRTPDCVLNAPVRFSIRHHDHTVIRTISGNPTKWRVKKPLQSWVTLVRTFTWRWCARPGGRVVVSARVGDQVAQRTVRASRCRSRSTSSKLIDSGPGTRRLPFTGSRTPAHMLSPNTPPPLSPALIRVTNSWMVSDGRTLVAAYAGEAGGDPSVGLLAVIRQNLVFGFQTRDIVNLGAIGSVRIAQAPHGSRVETSAQRGELRLTSAVGKQGIFHLASDTFVALP